MKKYFIIFLAIQFSISCFSQTPAPGQLKISIESFKCINQSWDGLIEFDGHGNEVFIDYGYRVYNPSNPGAMKPGAGFTTVYGSTGNGRIKAGTANAIGGIANGDEVMVNTLVLNEHVDADNLIIFSPSVWEWDNSNNDRLNLFNQQLAADLNWVMAQPYPFLNASINSNDPYNGRFIKIGDKYSSYWPILKYNTILKPLVNVQDNRPVGAETGPFNGENLALYNPALLILDTKVLMAVYNYNKSIAAINHPERGSLLSDVVEIVFTENTYAIVTSNGSYSLKLRIEFTPDAPALAPSPKWSLAPTKTVNTIKQDLPMRNIKAANTAFFVSGTWSGTQTNDYGLYPQAVSFQLTNTGEFIMANTQTGTVDAKGTYTFSNNIINGTYKLLSSGETISFTGTFDANTQKLNCSLGAGTVTNGQGKWIVSKK